MSERTKWLVGLIILAILLYSLIPIGEALRETQICPRCCRYDTVPTHQWGHNGIAFFCRDCNNEWIEHMDNVSSGVMRDRR